MMAALAALVGVRVALPLLVLARSGRPLADGFPVYRYNPLDGDAYGYYFAVRELLATLQRRAAIVAPAALLATVIGLVALRSLRGPARIVAVTWAAALVATALVASMRAPGAVTIGWSLVWGIPLLPYRLLGLPLDPDVAFGVALALSLTANAVSVVATFALGLAMTRRLSIALIGAALFALWPFIALVLAGRHGAANGTWQDDLGLSAYTEPLSTALVLVALALVLRRGAGTTSAALAGSLLGLATAVRLSNGLIAACVVAGLLLVFRDRGRALAVVVAGAAFLPVVASYWSKGYPMVPSSQFRHPFALEYASRAWSHSLLWHPAVLVALVPLAVVGCFVVDRGAALVVAACISVTATFYTFYSFTPIHPRFFFVVLPLVLLLWAAGAIAVTSTVRARV